LGRDRLRLLGNLAMNIALRSDSAPTDIILLLNSRVVLLIARIMVTAPFIVGGLTKLLNWQAGVAEMAHVGLYPASFFNALTFCTQLIGSALVIANRWTWLGAGALGIFTLWATYLAHRFWDYTGDERFMQMNSFFEHWTIAAAFILVAAMSFRNRPNVQ
jgi:transmembrane protein